MRGLLVAASLFALGCQRVADEKADYGAEVSRAEVNHALARAMAGTSVASARVGTSVSYQTVRRAGDAGAAIDLGSSSVTIAGDRLAPDGRRELRVQIDRRTRDEGGEFKTTRAEETLVSEIVGAHAAPTVGAARVTYHRLRTAEETLPAPAAVRARPDCGGLVGCVVHVRYVLFDLVAHPDAGGEPQKVTLTLGFSVETPYLPHGEGLDRFDGALVVECRASTVRLASHAVPVRECRHLIDFQK